MPLSDCCRAVRVNNTDIIVKPCPGLTPERARDARARAWKYVFDCYGKKKGGVPSTARNDGKEIKLIDENRREEGD